MRTTVTPHRSNNCGSFVLDREISRIGRIHISSGTKDPDLFRRINDMITTLRETGRWDLLQRMRDRELKPLQVWGAFKLGQLDHIPAAEEILSAKAEIDQWLPRADVKEKQRDSYRRGLTELLTAAGATVTALPKLLREFKAKCQDDGRRRTFNMTRSGLQAFMRARFGSSHRLWRAVADIERLKETPRPGNPQSLEQVTAIGTALGNYRSDLWSICLTGMRRAEYWKDGETGHGPWEVRGDRTMITGKGGKVRFVPLLVPPAEPSIGYSAFLRRLKEATDSKVVVHDLRKTYTRWMQESGVPRTRRKLYLGHGKTDVTDLYELHEVSAFIAHDADTLRAYVGESLSQAIRRVG